MKSRLGAAVDAQLPQDIQNVGLDRLLFHEQLTGYLPVRLATRHKLQDLGLALSKGLGVLWGANFTHQARRSLGASWTLPSAAPLIARCSSSASASLRR